MTQIDRKSYDYTLLLSKPDWAWEFMRRNPDYKTDWSALIRQGSPQSEQAQGSTRIISLRRSHAGAAKWGLIAFRRSGPDRA